MKKEEILIKHLTPLVKRHPEKYISFEEMKHTIEWHSVLNAMEEYKKISEQQNTMENFKEWKKEMMKWCKSDIIDLLAKVIIERQQKPPL